MKNQKVDFSKETCVKIDSAIHDILEGVCSKVIVNDNVKVYQCTNIIRVDLKVVDDN